MSPPDEYHDPGPDQIVLMVAGLVEAFGDRAADVAQRQHEMAVDGDKVTWQRIIDLIDAKDLRDKP